MTLRRQLRGPLGLCLALLATACAAPEPPAAREVRCADPQTETHGRSRARDRGDPSAAEQLMLELVNRARANPGAEASRLGIALDEGTSPPLQDGPRHPLAFAARLLQAARGHSQDMIDRDFFDHDNPDGADPFDRIGAAGYRFATAGENLYLSLANQALDPVAEAAGGHAALFVDASYAGRGHRRNLVDADFSEIGIGVTGGGFVDGGRELQAVAVTQDFGHPLSGAVPILLGVAYRDANGNGTYDGGEGLAGLTVTLRGDDAVRATTGSAGGYAFDIDASGAFELEFKPIDGEARCLVVTVEDRSVKADLLVTP